MLFEVRLCRGVFTYRNVASRDRSGTGSGPVYELKSWRGRSRQGHYSSLRKFRRARSRAADGPTVACGRPCYRSTAATSDGKCELRSESSSYVLLCVHRHRAS